MKYTILLFLLVFSVPVTASDENGGYLLLVPLTCAIYAENRPLVNMRAAEHRMYIIGHLNAVNAHVPDVYDILNGTKFDSIFYWMDRYCTDNPLMNIGNGLTVLVDELWPDRAISAPD
jgi:hypothetical protein